jgi:uncharacterized protein YggE
MLIGIAVVVIALFLRQPEKQIPIVQDIQVTQPKQRNITVTGLGEVPVKPDTVEFIIHIETNEKELDRAKDENSKIEKKVMALLNKYAIPENDIKVDLLRVKPGLAGQLIYNYVADKSIRVSLHDLNMVEPLFIELQAMTTIKVSDITVSATNIVSYQEQALQNAYAVAEQKAKAVGRTMGVEIGKAISIQEYSDNYLYNTGSFNVGSLDAENVFENMKAFALTEIIFTVKVTVEFEIK